MENEKNLRPQSQREGQRERRRGRPTDRRVDKDRHDSSFEIYFQMLMLCLRESQNCDFLKTFPRQRACV